jgi:hypothetical protein
MPKHPSNRHKSKKLGAAAPRKGSEKQMQTSSSPYDNPSGSKHGVDPEKSKEKEHEKPEKDKEKDQGQDKEKDKDSEAGSESDPDKDSEAPPSPEEVEKLNQQMAKIKQKLEKAAQHAPGVIPPLAPLEPSPSGSKESK